MPLVMQVLFFGALLSAIKSTASATCWRPASTFTENIWRQFRPGGTDRENLRDAHHHAALQRRRAGLRHRMQGTPIYELVSGAYQVPLVGAFVPLVCGLYWKRATTQGAIASIVGWHRRLAAVLGHAVGPCPRPSRPSWRACWRVRGHGGRLAAAAEAANRTRRTGPWRPTGLKRRAASAPWQGRPYNRGLCERPLRRFFDPNSMPIYAYKCSACGFAKDALQKMSDAPLTVCPACGASAFKSRSRPPASSSRARAGT
jgi:putative FmdB family regulatory protein